MNQKSIAAVLCQLRPGAQWVIHSQDLSELEWLDSQQTRPSDEEIIKAVSAYSPPPSLEEQVKQLTALVSKLTA